MRMNGGRLEFIVDADTEEGAAIGEEYEIYDEIAEAFKGNVTVDSEMTSDEWGDFYSAFAPVLTLAECDGERYIVRIPSGS
jgi:methyl-accepting chemotaxis protein